MCQAGCEDGKFCEAQPPQGVTSKVSLYYEFVDDHSTLLDVWMSSSQQVSGIQFHLTCLEHSAISVEKVSGGLFDSHDIQSNVVGNKVMAVSLGKNATEAGWRWLVCRVELCFRITSSPRFQLVNAYCCCIESIPRAGSASSILKHANLTTYVFPIFLQWGHFRSI